MSEISRLLSSGLDGQEELDAAFDEIYAELKRHARSSLSRLPHGATLTPTALVSEAYVKLSQAAQLDVTSRRHFFAIAARAMRHIILDQARSSQAQKRGGQQYSVTLDESHLILASTAEELLDLDAALGDLGRMSSRQRELVELKFFAGLSIQDIAEVMDISVRTAWREWERARAYLHARLQRA